ncbi:hypothetical protein BO82DRAFT_61454 [Aspergillus uvarum CBS 121591]|uniref:AAA+ ATPase domain-containing protein n=1 Tax=Aspergillus uvarum CBS 121591 TaxID=1448315 RepID=A0A319CDT4_9EURO|nr:hypothetical protein BO82DRAFT_61454 [Aspergillus uvarum CBS 121591]PYH82389.1 hypothetical protein BO82DRAFT_61454 [Aspergillus uvarum CBS 121591]
MKKAFNIGKDIIKTGPEASLSAVPIAKFGSIRTADRSEIEDFHRISEKIKKYLQSAENYYTISKEGDADLNPALIQPLSIAVFGAPGSGKSFVVKQILEKVTEKMTTPKKLTKYPVLEYNLSQFIDITNLQFAFQEARDATVSGRIPLVIFDEFDTTLNGELGWLKFFLAPMQDGQFFDQGKYRPIGHAVFIFIGGTRSTFAKFQDDKIQLVNVATVDSEPVTNNGKFTNQFQDTSWRRDSFSEYYEAKHERAERAVKKPDFVTRLQDHLDIRGYQMPSKKDSDPKFLIRRAILIRNKLEQLSKSGRRTITLDDAAIGFLLKDEIFTHGARTLDNKFKNGKILNDKLSIDLNSSESSDEGSRSSGNNGSPDHERGPSPTSGSRTNRSPSEREMQQNGSLPGSMVPAPQDRIMGWVRVCFDDLRQGSNQNSSQAGISSSLPSPAQDSSSANGSS